MIKLLWRTDVHMSDKSPSSRTDDWAATIFEKLQQVHNVAVKVGAAAILDGGDFFHVKSPSRNSHEMVRRVIEHHARYEVPVYCTPGNHDCTYGDYAFLPQQPLGVLFSSSVFLRLYDEHEVTFEDGVGDSKVSVRVVGIPYHGTKYDMERFRKIERKGEDFLVCVAHVLASQNGGTMFEGEDIIRYADLMDTAPDLFCFGHWHKDQGVTEIGNKTFLNIGSLTRGSLSQDEVQRQPACAVLTFEKGQPLRTQTVRLRVRPAEEVFDVEGRVKQIQRQDEMDEFVSRIRESLVPITNELSLTDVVREVPDVADDVRERALAYLERV